MLESMKHLFHGIRELLEALSDIFTSVADILQDIVATGVGVLFLYFLILKPLIKIVFGNRDEKLYWLTVILSLILLFGFILFIVIMKIYYGWTGFILGFVLCYAAFKLYFRFVDIKKFEE